MRQTAPLLLFVLVLASGIAVADDEPPGQPTLLTPVEAADAAIAAVQTGDQDALAALAGMDDPDPWVVADELCNRGEHAAARALATASSTKAMEGLPAYVEARRGKAHDPAAGLVLAALDAALARADWQAALRATEESPTEPDTLISIRIAYGRAVALFRVGRRKDSVQAFRAAADGAHALGWLRQESSALQGIGFVAYRLPDWNVAIAAWTARLPLLAALGDGFNTATTLIDLGTAHQRLGAFDEALDAYNRAMQVVEQHGDKRMLAGILGNVGLVHEKRGDYAQALATYGRVLPIVEALQDARGIAGILSNMGMAYQQLGALEEAVSVYRRALAIEEAAGNEVGIARTLGNLGNVLQSQGRFHEALEAYDRSKALDKARNDKPRYATVLTNIGILHKRLGAYAQALESFQEALRVHESTGAQQKVAVALNNLGAVHHEIDELAEAQDCFDRALEVYEASGSKGGMATALLNVAAIQMTRGASDAAIESFQRAITLAEATKARPILVNALIGLATGLRKMGRTDDALAQYERALDVLEDCPLPEAHARILSGLASTRGAQEQWAAAVRRAREAVGVIDLLLAGLGEEQGARARDLWTAPFEVGALAAFNTGSMEDLTHFVEGGRARSLLESLDGRTALRSVLVPAELRNEETSARVAVNRAVQAVRAASSGGGLRAMRSAAQQLDGARGRLEATVTKIQRVAKATASLAYPDPDHLTAIQERLTGSEALVLYGQAGDEALAVVIEADGARAVHLGPASAVLEACAALVPDEHPYVDAEHADALRELVVEPLGLGQGVRRVLVSPVGRLGYVPFALLLPGREVAYVPSATTHGVLLAELDFAGRGVLALGDPDYGNPRSGNSGAHRGAGLTRLSPLPATRAEAEAVGEVTLLGRKAAEGTFTQAIGTRSRWRAVHFACHGLVDPDRPMLSALALSADAENDGLLTCLEIFRMKIPADLVVLSACETGKGKIYRTEGIVGLTRAFMFAGAPRVICSLWKVDDEATQALMIKFYELWNPKEGKGLSTAAALKKAQEYVRDHPDHPDWKHPHYWAAWVLWGLPE